MKHLLVTRVLTAFIKVGLCQPTLDGSNTVLPKIYGNTQSGIFEIKANKVDDSPSIALVGKDFADFPTWKGAVIVNSSFFRPGGGLSLGTPIVPTGFLLAVKGKMICEEVQVKLNASWPDYVFARDYKLKPLSEIESYIKKNQHLPEIPSACEVEKYGIAIGEMNEKLLKKIEELTLYLIDEQKKRLEQDKKIEELKRLLLEGQRK